MLKFKLVALVACFLVSTGCEQKQLMTEPAESPSGVGTGGHAHPSHGPHGGELIELGQEDYHAELVHQDGAVLLYVLDGAASGPVNVAAETLLLNLKHDGEIKSFALTAKSEGEDGKGAASEFVSEDASLHEWLDAGAEGALTIEIEGRSFTGSVKHDHDHSHGDSHGHGDSHRHDDDHEHESGQGHDHGDDLHHDHDHDHGHGHDDEEGHEHGEVKE